MKIKNLRKLAKTKNRKAALAIAEAGLQAIDTEAVVRNAIHIEGERLVVQRESFELKNIGRIIVAGVGKCAIEAAHALESILGDRLTGGVVIDVSDGKRLKKIQAHIGTHPLPSQQNVEATNKLIELLRDVGEDDLVLFVISGGGSTLLSLPERGTVEDEVKLFHTLTNAGATIQEINTVRKHTSLARGGRLAQYAYPAKSVSLIFSDVPGDEIQFVASGPTVKDTTTVIDAQAIFEKYDVLKKSGIESFTFVETPKENKYFESASAILVASNEIALWAMAEEARKRGFSPKLSSSNLSGEARIIAHTIVEELHTAPEKTVLLYGGETTVTVTGHGKGGRNMELVLAATETISDGEVVLSLASDGKDNVEYAGALCDTITKEKAVAARLDIQQYLQENNGYVFFKTIGDQILTGDTGSNVSDLVVALKQ